MGPNRPEQPILEYRPRGGQPAPRIEARHWVDVSTSVGVTSWLSMLLLCAGGWWPCIPLGLAATGLSAAVVAMVQPLQREAVGGAMVATFLNFLVLAIWLLALGLF